MNIVLGYPALIPVNEKEFIRTYGLTPDALIEQYEADIVIDDLSNKYIVSLEMRCLPKFDFIEDGLYCFDILGIYTPKANQSAHLKYCGHISFVDIRDDEEKRICLLHKDDEGFPQTLTEWYKENIQWMLKDNGTRDGRIPTVSNVIEVVELIVKARCQNPMLELNIKPEDIIVLQGL